MPSCLHDAATNPSLDLVHARAARTVADWSHAAWHIASALAVDPHRPDVIAELRALIADAGNDPDHLAPIDGDEPWYGLVALHAWLRAERGELDVAIDLVCRVVAIRPDVPYLDWVIGWLDAPVAIDPQAAHVALSRLLVVEAPPWTPEVVAHLYTAVLRISRRFRTLNPEYDDLLALEAVAARRSGRGDEAVAVAQEAFDRRGDYAAAVALANALRARGDVDRAIEVYRMADGLADDPDAVRLDLADMLLDADRLDESEAVYRQVLDADPSNGWALPSMHYVSFLQHRDPASREALRELVDTHPHNERAGALLDAITPWVGYLPPPIETTINTLRRLTSQYEPGAFEQARRLPIKLPILEAPSTRLALAQTLDLYGTLTAEIEVGRIPTPDPREPLSPIGIELWRWHGTNPTPALPAPPAEVVEAIAALAAQPYHLQSWKVQALTVARQLAGHRIQDVLAAAVHPPGPPVVSVPWTWIQRYQVAVALVLAAWVEDRDSPAWLALESMALGPSDWTATAGIVAMCELAIDRPFLAGAVVDALFGWFDREPSEGYWCVEGALVYSLLRLPGLSRETRRLLEGRRHRLEHLTRATAPKAVAS